MKSSNQLELKGEGGRRDRGQNLPKNTAYSAISGRFSTVASVAVFGQTWSQAVYPIVVCSQRIPHSFTVPQPQPTAHSIRERVYNSPSVPLPDATSQKHFWTDFFLFAAVTRRGWEQSDLFKLIWTSHNRKSAQSCLVHTGCVCIRAVVVSKQQRGLEENPQMVLTCYALVCFAM